MGLPRGVPRGRAGLLAIGVVASVAVAGCGGGDESEGTDREEIGAVLGQLRSAQDSGNAELACREVYVIGEPERPGSAEGAQAEEEAGGEGEGATLAECEAAFRVADERRRQEVSDLTTEIGTIEVDGDEATAIVHTELRRADGSSLSQDVPYDLVHTTEGWRVRIAEEG